MTRAPAQSQLASALPAWLSLISCFIFCSGPPPRVEIAFLRGLPKCTELCYKIDKISIADNGVEAEPDLGSHRWEASTLDGINNDAAALVGVVERLQRARDRIRAMAMVKATVWACAAGLASLVILELARRTLPQFWHDLFGMQGLEYVALLSLAAALCVLAGGGLAAIVATPQIDILARRADSMFGLAERVSTALEAERRMAGNSPSTVVVALIDDMAHRTHAIDAGKLATFRLPRITFAIPLAAIALALIVTIVPVGTLPQSGTDPGQYEVLTEPERSQAALDIGRVANIVDEQIASRSDPYMEAVANSLRSLGERLVNAPQTTRGELLIELDALKDYAAAAGREWRGDAGQRIPELIDALSKSLAQPRASLGSEEGGAPQIGLPEEMENRATPDAPGVQNTPPNDLDSMLAELEARQNPATAPTGADGALPSTSLDYTEVAKAQNVARSAAAAQNLDGAQLLGPSPDARAGDSLLAGEGTDAIGTEPAAPVLLDFETSSELMLEAADTGGGRRLELEVAPNTSLTEITPESLGDSAQGWRRMPEAQVARDAIGFDDREAVSNYLRALMGQSLQ